MTGFCVGGVENGFHVVVLHNKVGLNVVVVGGGVATGTIE